MAIKGASELLIAARSDISRSSLLPASAAEQEPVRLHHGAMGLPSHRAPGEFEAHEPPQGNAAKQKTQPRSGTCVTKTAFEERKNKTERKKVRQRHVEWLAS